MWDECNCAVVGDSLALPFFGIGMKTDLFQSCGHCWAFQICWHIECSTFTASFYQILNSSAGIPSPPLAVFIVMLPQAHLTSHSRMPSSRWVIRRRKWQPTPVFLPGESHGQRSLVGYIVHRVAKSRTGLSDFTFTLNILCIAFPWDWNENWSFPVLWLLLGFPNLLAYWVQHFHRVIF